MRSRNDNPLFSYDERMRKKHPVVAGIDEAGRGPLAGPVVAAAVVLQPGRIIKGVRDSKHIPEKERIRLFWKIVEGAQGIGIGVVDAATIDRVNILNATRRAMSMAVKDLMWVPDILLIDAVSLQDCTVIQRSIIKGESVSASIAAASIVAKTVRDDIMLTYHEEFPLYNFRGHKGYSTKEHVERIRLYGPCPIHRKSFRQVMEMDLPLELQ